MTPALILPPTIHDLYDLFDEPVPRFEHEADDAAPEPYRTLLAHTNHMTVTLEAHYDTRLDLTVLGSVRRNHLYARKILLTAGDCGPVVQFGIMQFNFHHCTEQVRDLILEEATPLGRILIEHTQLRRISLHGLLRIEPSEDMRRSFDIEENKQRVYGRLATIFCDNEPAVSLLEVVRP